jgi:hypothetical protein
MPGTAGRKKGAKAVSALPAEPEVLRVIGEESERNGTSKLTLRQINQTIKAARAAKPSR